MIINKQRHMEEVIPTILSFNKRVFSSKLEKLRKISNEIQIDFMDKKFVPTKSVALEEVPSLNRYKNVFEAHLMVENPDEWVTPLKEKGFSRIIFHYEAVKKKEIIRLARKIKRQGMEPILAINPGTRAENIYAYLSHFKKILFLGVRPGREHQKFKLVVYNQIRKLREKNKKIIIQVDGGVTPEVAGKLRLLGANIINSGSYISSNKNPEKAFKKISEAFK